MSASRKPEFSSSFLESYMYELMSMSDEEILEGQDIDKVQERAATRIAAANREAGRKRLAAAKARVQRREDIAPSHSSASLEEVRAYINEAANDGRVTLAARQLSEMSEADARRLYSQLKQLRTGQGDDE
ncbi:MULTISPECIES: hypothetical protein [Burkholderia]|uniref:Uncharacterized protein n=1 Tax=Burkholderia pyrrocinia TaxID=60550 RepID=A0A318J0X8_BURPY|nr:MULTISPECIES: hypothetical protein [Burkholderia]PXX41255.1 hypothetical protein NA66_1001865 [Burkholderia pyrrocinia]SFW82343.1 hypothetical protein SAMN03159384_05569 [Burkholderia sp. NFACC33-1]SFY44026.1 hypothetical protein SAMN03159408_05711 [Burkholderia sp. NFPP32]